MVTVFCCLRSSPCIFWFSFDWKINLVPDILTLQKVSPSQSSFIMKIFLFPIDNIRAYNLHLTYWLAKDTIFQINFLRSLLGQFSKQWQSIFPLTHNDPFTNITI